MIDDTRRRRDRGRFAGLTSGLILIAIGTAFLLSELRLISFREAWRWWPALLVVFGLGRVLSTDSWRRRKGGLVMIMVGLWGFLNVYEVGPFYWGNSWPLLLIGFGLLAIGEAVFLGNRRRGEGSSPPDEMPSYRTPPPVPPPSPEKPIGGDDVR